MVKDGNTRVTFSLPEELDVALDDCAASWSKNRSQIVESALREYLDLDRTARLEEKLDRVLAAVEEGGTPSEPIPEKKEKESQQEVDDNSEDLPADTLPEDVSSTKEKRANKMFNFILREYGDRPLITENEITEAVEEVYSSTEYMIEQYAPEIAKRLDDSCLKKHKYNEVWYLDNEAYSNHIHSIWKDSKKLLVDGEMPSGYSEYDTQDEIEEIQNALVSLAEGSATRQAILDEDLVSEEEIEDTRKKGEKRIDENMMSRTSR